PDSAFVGGPGAPIMIARDGADVPAWTLPLLDEHDAVAGVATVVGGAERATVWIRTGAPTVSWPALLATLRQALDRAIGSAPEKTMATSPRSGALLPAGRMGSVPDPEGRGAPDTTRAAARVRFGRPEAVITSRGTLFVLSAMGAGADGAPLVRAVAISDGVQVYVARSLAEALRAFGETVEDSVGGPAAPMGLAQSAPGREAARRWYDAMREALKQGNWSAFGAAFDSLGRSLGRPPQ
ncbi:MAG: hypothetical protein EBV77_12130, partial [Gemmatimonadaceae bacterium]|nr:hypothetical protein [Gemmatimonadaceae bacterium]